MLSEGSAIFPTGVVPRSIKKLFQLIESNQRHAGTDMILIAPTSLFRYIHTCIRFPPPSDFTVTMATLEIYNEEIFDLQRVRDRGLPIRQDDKGRIHVQGLSEA
jgi:hypothetical protein